MRLILEYSRSLRASFALFSSGSRALALAPPRTVVVVVVCDSYFVVVVVVAVIVGVFLIFVGIVFPVVFNNICDERVIDL